jgi:hypothetical protein
MASLNDRTWTPGRSAIHVHPFLTTMISVSVKSVNFWMDSRHGLKRDSSPSNAVGIMIDIFTIQRPTLRMYWMSFGY